MPSMKIQVVYPNGQHATLEVQLPLRVSLGPELNAIVGADGVEHFFTVDGTYDGWARSINVQSGVTLHPQPMPEELGFFKRHALLRHLRRVK